MNSLRLVPVKLSVSINKTFLFTVHQNSTTITVLLVIREINAETDETVLVYSRHRSVVAL